MKSVSVSFGRGSQRYSYLVLEGDEPCVGDLVLTSITWSQPGPYHDCAEQMKMARVLEVHEVADDKATKFYLHLISREAVRAQMEKNKAILERARERRRIRAELTRMMTEASERDLFGRLAESSPAAAELLRKLDELQ